MPVELTRINATQVEALPRNKTVFFFPVGPIEDHGPHLPVGLDLEEAQRLCFIAAQHLEEEMMGWVGVLMPPAPLGIESNTTKFAFTVRPHVLRDWLVDACNALKRAGFRHFVCFSGHLGPRQLTAIETAGKKISKARWWEKLGRRIVFGPGEVGPTLISACSALVSPREVWKSPLWPDPSEHGGTRDTAVALAIVPSDVDPAFSGLPEIKRRPSRWTRLRMRRARTLGGYWGVPSRATSQYGEKVMIGEIEELFPKMRAVWEGTNPEHIFRSYYSVLPPNKPFFKAWLLALLNVGLLAVWLYYMTLAGMEIQ